ncbi:MAG: hypothetical protein AUJ98_11285 [Bacteroidetes bacterium CG2_30_33_31]|nr:MAG: hypothetical protein AUJ98_11285 [Bacteroidetes bacterium CG2_30_33_31]
MESKSLDYNNLLFHLVKDFSWPNEYMFKFIVPFDVSSLNELKALFHSKAKVSHRESKNGKYISLTALQIMENPDEVIEIYLKAEKIKDIIAL